MLANKMRSKLMPTRAVAPVDVIPDIVEEPPSIVDMIDGVLEERSKKLSFFRPSMLFGCDRANYFYYTGAPSHPQRQRPKMLRILDNGSAIHTVIQDYLSHLPDWWFAPESKIYTQVEGAWIRGSCDGVLIRRSDGYRVGLEIKTIAHDSWMRLSKPQEKHVFQASIYAKLQGLKWIVILYWDKNTQDLKEFPVRVNEATWKSTAERIKMLKSYVDKGELPRYDPSTCDKTFCAHVDFCRSQGAPV